MRLRVLDLFCGEGGAGAGYALAGHDVVGIDVYPQPRYPYKFIQAGALWYLERHAAEFDFIHASPPCQAYSKTQRLSNKAYPRLIEPTRQALVASGIPYVIENVEGAPLYNAVMLCGAMFGIRTYRHRLFETGNGFTLQAPLHPSHVAETAKMGRPVLPGQYMHIVGNFPDVRLAREIMGMPWASRDGLAEALPVVYTEYIGRKLIETGEIHDGS